jgi:sugar phosphate isomerase/epimerase
LISTNEAELKKLPIGCQTYPVRDQIEKDFAGTLKQLADAGFQEVELCSPVGYANYGFGNLARYKPSEIQQMLSDLGLKCQSAHFSVKELRENPAGTIAWANDMGLTQMFVPTLAGPLHPGKDDVVKAADEFNQLGERTAQAGMQLGLHNEDFEFTTVDGQRTYDLLLSLLDPELIKFQFQCSAISRGYDPAEYFLKYPGRFTSMHLQDWSAAANKTVAVGQGDLNWQRIFTAAKISGLKSYFVELNLEAMKASVLYLRELAICQNWNSVT